MPSEIVTPTPTQDVGDRAARRRLIRNAVIAFVAVCALLVMSYVVPVPTVANVRSWGQDLGPGFVWVFFLAYALVTVFPIPRTVFTVSAGVLFGPVVGLTGALISTAVAATLGFLLARWAGRDRVTPFLSRPVVMTIDARLAARGWLAIGSLRLIPICPFWLLNWCAGLSSVRLLTDAVKRLSSPSSYERIPKRTLLPVPGVCGERRMPRCLGRGVYKPPASMVERGEHVAHLLMTRYARCTSRYRSLSVWHDSYFQCL